MNIFQSVRAAAVSIMLAAALSGPSAAEQTGNIVVENAWAATTNPGASVAAGYVTLHNTSSRADRLVSARSRRAERVELHEMRVENGIMRMQPVGAIDVPARGAATLRPGGLHLMFIDIDAAFVEGERIPVTLHFERGGDVAATFVARPRTVSGEAHHDH